MIRDYQLVSPSLEGVLNDATLSYEGLSRPLKLMRVLDGPRARGRAKVAHNEACDDLPQTDESSKAENRKVLEDYFHDLYGVFMKNLSFFIVQAESTSEDTVKLQAMLQEMIKVKRLMGY